MNLCPKCQKHQKRDYEEECVFCRMDTLKKELKEEIVIKTKEKDMDDSRGNGKKKVFPSKVCIQCHEEFIPTSNNQKRCKPCAKEAKRERDRERRRRLREKAKQIHHKEEKESQIISMQDRPKESRKIPINGSTTAIMAQLLHVSNLIDGQINAVLSEGSIEMQTIVDIRHRLGYILQKALNEEVEA